jgi:hypothetical protein
MLGIKENADNRQMDIEITFADRCRAKHIVKKLRDSAGLPDVARILGMRTHYVVYAEYMTHPKDPKTGQHCEDRYSCPKWAIRKILDWAETP